MCYTGAANDTTRCNACSVSLAQLLNQGVCLTFQAVTVPSPCINLSPVVLLARWDAVYHESFHAQPDLVCLSTCRCAHIAVISYPTHSSCPLFGTYEDSEVQAGFGEQLQLGIGGLRDKACTCSRLYVSLLPTTVFCLCKLW